jgi:anti-sigma factor RsiW
MANESAKDRRFTAYLLGQLSEAERTEIEDKYFAEDATFEYLAAVETELIDVYVRGELAAADRAQFEQRFLEAPRLRARVEFARQLQARAMALLAAPAARETIQQETPQPEKPRPATPQPASHRSISPLIATAACVGAVLAGAGGWWAYQSARSKAAEVVQAAPAPPAEQHVPVSMPIAPPQPTPVSLTTTPAGPVDLVLAPGTASSRDGSAVLTLSPSAEAVRIQIDHDGPVRERYAVIVATRDRHRVWTESSLAGRTPTAKSVILQIPAASLPAGEYLLTLSGGPLQARRLEFVADYSLRVK